MCLIAAVNEILLSLTTIAAIVNQSDVYDERQTSLGHSTYNEFQILNLYNRNKYEMIYIIYFPAKPVDFHTLVIKNQAEYPNECSQQPEGFSIQ